MEKETEPVKKTNIYYAPVHAVKFKNVENEPEVIIKIWEGIFKWPMKAVWTDDFGLLIKPKNGTV